MLTSNQRDIIAGILVSISANHIQYLSIEQVIKMYELTRKSVEEVDIGLGEREQGREESL